MKTWPNAMITVARRFRGSVREVPLYVERADATSGATGQGFESPQPHPAKATL